MVLQPSQFCEKTYIHWSTDVYFEPRQTSMVELSSKNSERLKAIKYFCKKAPLWMFDRVLCMSLSRVQVLTIQRSSVFNINFVVQALSGPIDQQRHKTSATA